jgi:pantoate--beta-alanine ligase
MEVFHAAQKIASRCQSLKAAGKTIGFVPTMGALHTGHLSLLRACRRETDIAVVSIFVNPTQFNDNNDLRNYPRMPEKDVAMVETEGCDLVFMPGEKEIYPQPDTRVFDFGGLDAVMEGKHRPGHFNGVAQVVTRLFEIIKPHRAYFGTKDFQQLAIIRKITGDLNLPVDIIACPIIRESDGLAMSSRNMLLTPEQRIHAAVIPQTLFRAKAMVATHSVEEVKRFVTDTINNDPLLETEYFEIADNTTLQPVHTWEQPGPKTGCVAVKVGPIRLIDNINFSS